MSRFEDTLQRDLHVIADRATPSPDAWQQILNRAADQEPTQETEIIMLTENTLPTRRWPLVAAAAAIAVVAVGAIIAFGTGGDDTEQPADVPPATVAPAPETPDEQAVDDQTVDDPTDAQPAADAGPQPVPAEGQEIAPGRYSTDTFGLPVDFEVPDITSAPWEVVISNREAIILVSGDSHVAIKRIGSFYDADEAPAPATRGLGNIPPDGIDQWISENDVIVDTSDEVTVGGRTAQYRQIRIPTGSRTSRIECGDPPCLSAVSSSADHIAAFPGPTVLFSELPHSLWMVEMGQFEPLGIWAYTTEPDHQVWLDELAPLIASLEFGEPAPAVEGGTARLPLRVDVFASYSGTRTVGPLLDDGTREVITENTVEGDLVGELNAVGVQETPANGYDDLTFSGTIDGLGSGTLTMRQEWTGSASGDISTTTVVTGGTGDFEGFTGRVITSVDAPDESGEVPIYTGRMTLQLVVPQSG